MLGCVLLPIEFVHHPGRHSHPRRYAPEDSGLEGVVVNVERVDRVVDQIAMIDRTKFDVTCVFGCHSKRGWVVVRAICSPGIRLIPEIIASHRERMQASVPLVLRTS